MTDAQRVDEIGAQRAARFGAQPYNAPRGVVTLQRREIHAGDRTQQPGRLPFLLYSSACRDGRRAALDGAAIHPQPRNDVEVERDARIAIVGEKRTSRYGPQPVRESSRLHGGTMRIAAGNVNARRPTRRPSGTPRPLRAPAPAYTALLSPVPTRAAWRSPHRARGNTSARRARAVRCRRM